MNLSPQRESHSRLLPYQVYRSYKMRHTRTHTGTLTSNDHAKHIYIYIINKESCNNHTIIRATFVCVFVCVFVCSPSPPRSFDGSSPNLVGVCRWTSHLPLRGSFSKRSTGRRVNGSLSLSTILYMRQPHATRCNGAFSLAAGKQQSLILRLLLHCISTLYVGAPRNCP